MSLFLLWTLFKLKSDTKKIIFKNQYSANSILIRCYCFDFSTNFWNRKKQKNIFDNLNFLFQYQLEKINFRENARIKSFHCADSNYMKTMKENVFYSMIFSFEIVFYFFAQSKKIMSKIITLIKKRPLDNSFYSLCSAHFCRNFAC